MQNSIRQRQDGTIDYEFYRARAHADRRNARCAVIRSLLRFSGRRLFV
jgi:hypothetical protein